LSLKFGILGLLATQPLHGYEVKTRYEDLFGGTWDLNIGQVYTTLQRLERDGLVEAVGDRGDRGKQRYGLTGAGETALQSWLQSPEDEPQQLRQDIYLKLLLISRLANGNLDGLLARQRRVYLQRLKDLGDLEGRARREGRHDLVLLIQGAILHTEADLKWIDVCADEARGGIER
jgi:DNA-binding PadR family transcriptional regulator